MHWPNGTFYSALKAAGASGQRIAHRLGEVMGSATVLEGATRAAGMMGAAGTSGKTGKTGSLPE